RSCYKAADSKMYFGGQNGLTAFYPDSIQVSNYKPNIVITDLKIFNKSVEINSEILGMKILEKSITFTDEIELSYRHSVFSIEFASLDYTFPENNKYKYKMVGFDEDWIETNAKKRFATYTNLSGGEYVFKVRATNSSGVWNDMEKSLKIKVNPPFWKTAWFFSVLLILLLICIYVFIKVRERQLIKEKDKLEFQVKERTMEINMQKEEIEQQRDRLNETNNELRRINHLISDSLVYAKKIQEAMLPNPDVIKTYLSDFFLFFMPRDIVSGDFYWFYHLNDKIYLAAADCTGHGVPGAFMSMIGTTLLNEIVVEKEEYTPSEILLKLNAGVIKALNQQTGNSNLTQDDGMDITICAIDKSKNKVEIACANHVVYIVDDDEMITIQGECISIGGMFSVVGKRQYSNYVFPLNSGMLIYMFSDGYQDQFGGEKNKKFLGSKFKEMLYNNRHYPMNKQRDILEERFKDWKGGNKQVDDILVMGLKL
ncbi:MAG: triple tyrosine motif-containing protein, partial [Bacteroidales bacterium]